MLLVKVPVPSPSTVCTLSSAGQPAWSQQTPLAVTGDPPSEDIVPPLIAVFCVIEEAAVVEVTVGITAFVPFHPANLAHNHQAAYAFRLELRG